MENAGDVTHYVVVPEANYAETLGFDEGGAGGVLGLRGGVLTAVEFDDELGGVTGEVADVRADGDLLAPVVARQAFTKGAPEDALGIGHVLAQAAGSLDCV